MEGGCQPNPAQRRRTAWPGPRPHHNRPADQAPQHIMCAFPRIHRLFIQRIEPLICFDAFSASTIGLAADWCADLDPAIFSGRAKNGFALVGTEGAEGYCVNVPWSHGGVGDKAYVFAFQNVFLPIGYHLLIPIIMCVVILRRDIWCLLVSIAV
ncbi:hypothetical protein Dsin_032728 [Dipteronia sinensis]|uniref:Uncharacterized protein n=1 Tax=Dipteronia sinensis TaxID=43782 RepID=A0AAE0DI60_9ROSI|nr:hypothetical protein Dsin_032728 [Dipteronia sinensis]